MQLAYALPGADGSFYRYMYLQGDKVPGPGEFVDEVNLPGTIRADPTVKAATPIRDAHELGRASLGVQGFTLKQHADPLKPVTLETIKGFQEWCEQELLPKASAIAKEAVEESFGTVVAVHTIDYALRATDDVGLHMNFEPPVMEAHADFTPASANLRLRTESVKYKVGDQDPITVEDHVSNHVVMVNVWQPVVDTVYRKPLVVCDVRSVSEGDLVTKKMIYRHREGQVYNLRQNANQKWYYYPHMRSTDALCFLTMLPEGRTTPHSGALDPSDPVDSPARRSMEVRLMVKLQEPIKQTQKD